MTRLDGDPDDPGERPHVVGRAGGHRVDAAALARELGGSSADSAFHLIYPAILCGDVFLDLLAMVGALNHPLVHIGEDVQPVAVVEGTVKHECSASLIAVKRMGATTRLRVRSEIRDPWNELRYAKESLLQTSADLAFADFGEEVLTYRQAGLTTKQFRKLQSVEMPPDIGTRWAAISGDHQAIHLDTSAARAAGFRGTIVHGSYSFARCAQTLADTFCADTTARLRRLSVRFAKAVYPGDELHLEVADTEMVSAEGIGLTFRGLVGRKVVLRDGWAEVGT